jgi:transposase
MRGLTPEQRKRIVHKWGTVSGLSIRKLAKEEGVSVGAVQTALRKYREQCTFADSPRRGRKPGPADPTVDKKIKDYYKRHPSASVRDVAKKLGTSSTNVMRAKERMGLQTHRKQKQPKRSTKQAESVKPRARKLYDKLLTKKSGCVIMDDETYIKLDYKTLPGPQFYTSPKGKDVPASVKAVYTEKFGKKVMVWQAICECGKVSRPFITTDTMNGKIYVQECLQKRLLPLIKQHNNPTIFWPDLASCHYSKDALEWYEVNKVTCVPKDMNPPNCPEIRPIETFWALTKANLRKYMKPADSVEKFKKDWPKVVKMVGESTVQKLMSSVKRKVRKLACPTKTNAT